MNDHPKIRAAARALVKEVHDAIAPRMEKGLAPVDLLKLAADVERLAVEAVAQDRAELYREEEG